MHRVVPRYALAGGKWGLSRPESGGYDRWFIDHVFVMVPAQAFVAQHVETYKEFPPRQKAGSFNLDRVLEKLLEASGENK